MLNVLLDTNVLLDYLLQRDGFYERAALIIACTELQDYTAWMSASQVTDLFYIASGGRQSGCSKAKEAISHLRTWVRVCPVGEGEIDAALRSQAHDFEDEVVGQAALSIGCDAIVTRDKAFVPPHGVRVVQSEEFFQWLSEEHGITYPAAPGCEIV